MVNISHVQRDQIQGGFWKVLNLMKGNHIVYDRQEYSF